MANNNIKLTITEVEDIKVKIVAGLKGAKGDKGDAGDPGASAWGIIGGNIDDQTDLKSALDNPVTAGTGISVSGKIVTNSDLGSSAVTNHETTYNHANFNTAFSWGNHATAGYLTSFTETDPVFSSWISGTPPLYPGGWYDAVQNTISLTGFNNDLNYENPLTFGTGLTRVGNNVSCDITQYTDALAVSAIKADADWKASDWNSAYGWGDHAGLYLSTLSNSDISDLKDVDAYSITDAGKVLKVNATGDGTEWSEESKTDPAGNDKEIQFNDEGSFAGDSDLTWDDITKELKAKKVSSSDYIQTVKIKPVTDSTSALKISSSDEAKDVITVDTTNSRVGIGVDPPTVAFDVVATDGTTTAFEVKSNSPTTSNSVTWNLVNSSNNKKWQYAMKGSNANYAIWLAHNNGSIWIDPAWVVTADSRMGIGTTAPDRKLEINTGSSTNGLRVSYNDSNGSASKYAEFLLDSGGDLTITATGGDISLDNENLTTTGNITANNLAITNWNTALGRSALSSSGGVAIGSSSTSTGGNSIAIGADSKATGDNASAIGSYATANSTGACALGSRCSVNSKNLAVAKGYYSKAERTAEEVRSLNSSSTNKHNLGSVGWFKLSTTDATPTEIFLGDAANQRLTVIAKSVISFRINATARNDANNVCKAWNITGAIKRDASNNTALVGGAVTKTVIAQDGVYDTTYDTNNWDCVVTADDTNEALIITVTGEAGKTISWIAEAQYVEVRF